MHSYSYSWCYTETYWDYCKIYNQQKWSNLESKTCSSDPSNTLYIGFFLNSPIKNAEQVCQSFLVPIPGLAEKKMAKNCYADSSGQIVGVFEAFYDRFIDHRKENSPKCNLDFEFENLCDNDDELSKTNGRVKMSKKFDLTYESVNYWSL